MIGIGNPLTSTLLNQVQGLAKQLQSLQGPAKQLQGNLAGLSVKKMESPMESPLDSLKQGLESSLKDMLKKMGTPPADGQKKQPSVAELFGNGDAFDEDRKKKSVAARTKAAAGGKGGGGAQGAGGAEGGGGAQGAGGAEGAKAAGGAEGAKAAGEAGGAEAAGGADGGGEMSLGAVLAYVGKMLVKSINTLLQQLKDAAKQLDATTQSGGPTASQNQKIQELTFNLQQIQQTLNRVNETVTNLSKSQSDAQKATTQNLAV